jgi:hypothetical protein
MLLTIENCLCRDRNKPSTEADGNLLIVDFILTDGNIGLHLYRLLLYNFLDGDGAARLDGENALLLPSYGSVTGFTDVTNGLLVVSPTM